MFDELETSLKALLEGAIVGAPVYGTFDYVDFTAAGAPAVAVKVSWTGFRSAQQIKDAVRGDQRFAVEIIVNQIRVSTTARQAATTGIGTIIARLVGWRPKEDESAEIDTNAQPDEAGGLWVYPINLTIPDIRLRAS